MYSTPTITLEPSRGRTPGDQGHVSGDQGRMPGELGIWLFIAGDTVLFSLFFMTFLYYRSESPANFAFAQTYLNQTLGLLNTLLLLSSSWFVAQAVRAARRGFSKLTPSCLALAFLCGLGFGVVKAFEYGTKIRAGITLTTNDFFMFYYMFTGIHFLHVLIGMSVLAFLVRSTWVGPYDAARLRNLESGASFWHLVDLLWIVLFALLYLVK